MGRKSDMCENIREKKDALRTIYQELKEAGIPLFIWGAGSMSVEVENCLKEQGIPVEGFFINVGKEKAHMIPREQNIYILEEVAAKYESINVVMGHGHFEKRNLLKACPFIKKVYIIPNPYPQYRVEGIEAYWTEHKGEIESVMNCLDDDMSREALKAYFKVKETNDIHYLLETDFCIGNIFDFDKLELTDKENYLDVGAWTGDTISGFKKKVSNRYQSIAAIEPDPDSVRTLGEKIKEKENITLFPCGVGKENGILYLKNGNSQSAYASKESDSQTDTIKIEVKTLDELFENKNVSLIKIGIPFLFLDVLKGCKDVIRRNKPRFIINVAADNDMKVFDTIRWIDNLNLDYKMALRFDFPMPTRLHLYVC